MDGRPRQNPAYRSATGKPCICRVFLFSASTAVHHRCITRFPLRLPISEVARARSLCSCGIRRRDLADRGRSDRRLLNEQDDPAEPPSNQRDVRVELVARSGLFGRDALLQLVPLRTRRGLSAALSLLVRSSTAIRHGARSCSRRPKQVPRSYWRLVSETGCAGRLCSALAARQYVGVAGRAWGPQSCWASGGGWSGLAYPQLTSGPCGGWNSSKPRGCRGARGVRPSMTGAAPACWLARPLSGGLRRMRTPARAASARAPAG